MTTLGNLVDLVDCEHKTAPVSPHGEYFAVGTPAMRGNVINYVEARRIDRDTFELWTRRMEPRAGDVLFAREAPVGPVVRVPDAENIAPGQRTVLIRAIPELLDDRFLYYLLQSPRIQSMVQSLAAGSTVPHLNVADVRRLDVGSLPGIPIQRAIGEVLGALDDKAAVNRSVSDAGLEVLDSRFDGACAHVGKLEISELAQVVLGGTPNRKVEEYWGGDIPWVNSGACNSRVIISASEMITNLGLEKSAAKILPAGTTCVAITGATLGQMGWLASPMAANQSVVGVVAPPEDRLWLHLAVRAEKEQLMGWATGGAQQHVNKGAVGSLVVFYDPVSAEEFGKANRSFMDRVVRAEYENVVLASTRDELLPLLMSGKITVKDAEKTVEGVV